MQLSTTHSIFERPAFLGASRGGAAPLRVPNPDLDPLVDQQARFRIEGSGPLPQRRIIPASAGARELLAASDRIPDAVRGVLRLVEHAAGGPERGAQLEINGVAFANSPRGHGANTYRAHLDDDHVFRSGMAKLGSGRQEQAARNLGREVLAESLSSKANVIAGWANLGHTASGAMLAQHGIEIPGYNDAIGEGELAQAVRVVRHEAQHLADPTSPRLSSGGAMGLREALAEAHSRTLDHLAPARRLLGLDGLVSDAALQQAARTQPYADAERMLAGALRVAGLDPQGSEAAQLLRQPSDRVAEELVTRVARTTGTAVESAREQLGAEFARVLGRHA